MQTPGDRGRGPDRPARPPRLPGPRDPGFDPVAAADEHARRMLHPDRRADLRDLALDLDRLAEGSRPAGRGPIPVAAPPYDDDHGGYGGGDDYRDRRGHDVHHDRHDDRYDDDRYDGDDYDYDERRSRPDPDYVGVHGRRAPEREQEQSPVFVDASGNRRRMARRVSIGALGLLIGYGGLVAVSFAGGPIPPGVLLPVPGIPAAKGPATPADTAQGGHAPTASHPGDRASDPKTTAGGVPAGGPTPAATATTPGTKPVPTPSGTAPASAPTTSATKPGNGNASNTHKHTRPSP